MTPEWYLMLQSDPHGFWKLLNYYLTAPLTENGTVATAFLEFWEFVLKHPLGFLAIALFLLLLCGSLLASGIAIACDSRSEKKEQENRRLARSQQRCEKIVATAADSLEESEVSNQ